MTGARTERSERQMGSSFRLRAEHVESAMLSMVHAHSGFAPCSDKRWNAELLGGCVKSWGKDAVRGMLHATLEHAEAMANQPLWKQLPRALLLFSLKWAQAP